MLQVLLNGKLSREQENMEDILTSNVFGLLKYLKPTEGILKFFQKAEDIVGENPLAWMQDIREESIKSVTYLFWPWWNEMNLIGCEPDVVISLDIDIEKYLIVIEAKYLSGKSSEADYQYKAPTDQLGREWANLESVCNRETRTPVLIYLTADAGLPRDDIIAALNELKEKIPESEPKIYWLSWRHLYSVCANTDDVVLQDIKLLLDRLGLRFYDGINFSSQLKSLSWLFERPPIVFNWNMKGYHVDELWRFQ